MSIFTQRSNGYKSGIIFLWIGCLLFIIGFSSPNWTRTNLHYSGHSRSPARHPSGAMYRRGPLHIRGHNGLWVTCSEANGQTQCASVHSKTPDWFSAVHVLQSMALIGLVASCGYAVVINWMQLSPAHNRLVEIVAGVSGLLGFTGAIEYMVKSQGGLASLQDNAPAFVDPVYDNSHASWAFAVDLCGCVLSFLAAIVIAVHNKSLQSQVNPASSNTPQPHPSHSSNGNGPYPQAAATAAVPPPAPTPAPSVQVFYMPQAPAASALPMIPPAMNPPAYDLETNVTPAYDVDVKPPAYDANLPAAVEKRRLSVAVPAPVGGPSTEDQAVTTPITGVDDSLTASASSSPPPATTLAKP